MALPDLIAAQYAAADAVTVAGDQTADLQPGVRVAAWCGADGWRYGTVTTAGYDAAAGVTTITITPDAGPVTASLAGILIGTGSPASLANHGHTGQADGGAVSHAALSGIGTNAHAAIDAFMASKAAASGLASLDPSGLVVQNPASATATPAGTRIVLSDASGTVDSWVSDATTSAKGKVQLATTTETAAGSLATKAVTPAGLAASAKGLIAASTTIYVATTGSDSTGDGSSSAPFASISQALASIAGKLIASGVTVTIQVADGTYTISSTITVDHPDADKIQIHGNTTAETTVAISAINSGAKTITVAGDYSANILTGDIIGLTGSSTSGLNGAYLVSGVAYGGANTVITCSSETLASDTVGGGSIVIMPCNRCVLSSTTTVFTIKRPLSRIDGFSFLGNGSGSAVFATNQSAVSIFGRVIIYNFSSGVYALNRSVISIYGVVIKKCAAGIYAQCGTVNHYSTDGTLAIDSSTIKAVLITDSSFTTIAAAGIVVRDGLSGYYSPAANTVGNNNSYIKVS